MKTALVLLVLDEIEGLTQLWDAIPFSAFDDVFAVDGGSTDGSVEFLREKGLRVVAQSRKGRGAAMKAVLCATDCDAYCFFSPDGNEDPADAPRLRALLEQGADLAIASRMLPGAVNEEDVSLWRPRKWVSRAFTAAANVLWGAVLTDASNGLRAAKRTLIEAVSAEGFSVEYQMTIRALKAGRKVVEIPTREGARIGGRSKARSWPTGVAFLKELVGELAA